MKKIAVLGPKNTYSDVAKEAYLKSSGLDYETVYYPTIIRAIDAIDENTCAIVPFENSLDGFIMESLDKIIAKNLNIVAQTKLNIDFAFLANVERIEDVKEVYCQFKSYGQCLNFITSHSFYVNKTESNIESLEKLRAAKKGVGAIVPVHAVKKGEFPLEIWHVADKANNETRFFVLNHEPVNILTGDLEASLVFSAITDRPGILFEILKKFHDESLNLKAILSRPDKTGMGNYNFYLECSLKKDQTDGFKRILAEFRNDSDFKVKLLGVYKALE